MIIEVMIINVFIPIYLEKSITTAAHLYNEIFSTTFDILAKCAISLALKVF